MCSSNLFLHGKLIALINFSCKVCDGKCNARHPFSSARTLPAAAANVRATEQRHRRRAELGLFEPVGRTRSHGGVGQLRAAVFGRNKKGVGV